MKYGSLSQSNINSTVNTYFKVASGDTATRPTDPEDGMIRYNIDHEVANVGTNSGKGRFEVYYRGGWTPLISLIDFASPADLYSTGNVTLKVLADMIRDFFVQGMGLIEVNQSSTWKGVGDPAAAKAGNHSFMPVGNTNAPWGIPNQKPMCINTDDYPGNTGAASHHTSRAVQQIQPIYKPVVGDGMIYDIDLTDGGAGYDQNNPPSVVIETGGGEGARIKLEVDKDSISGTYGQIINAVVTETGEGYHPSFTKTYLKGGGGQHGELSLTIDARGRITGVTIDNPGEHYETPPTVSIADGGTRAYAEIASSDISGGVIQKITIISKGIDYIINDPARFPQIKIISSAGGGAVATPLLGDGKIIDVEVLRGGSGFKVAPSVVIHGNGTGAQYIVAANNFENGVVTGTTMQDMGSGYTTATATIASTTTPPTTQATSNSYAMYSGRTTSVIFEFDLDLFVGCGVPEDKCKDYNIGLFNSLYKVITRYGHLNNSNYGRDYLQTVKMVPKWDVNAADPYTEKDGSGDRTYGVYACKVFLQGVRPYYSASCGAVWFGSLTKWRNF
jgi:hypothetical protein